MVATKTAVDVEGVERYRTELLSRGFDDATQRLPDDTGTLCGPPDGDVRSELDGLPVLVGDGDRGELALGARIGAGGMGQVHVAHQQPLLREVAVKQAVRGATDRHENASAILREARITGALEHPNIVPIHALGRTASGEVLFAMKRIEGSAWSELLRRRASLDRDLERHVRILIEVCRAVHFAHSRGIVHRDLKPENVMIGRFDEVYVLDWGIAVSIGDTHIKGVTHADDVKTVTGTPQYLAPEMAMPGDGLDERTDIYLLGGMLHVMLTGHAPHNCGSVGEMLHAAWVSKEPVFDNDVPDELAAICKKALSRDRRARFSTAHQMRDALDEFLRHRSARAVTREAVQRLADLRALLARADASDLDANRLFSSSRFGFELALREWPESAEARAGLESTLATMARYEIKRRHADAARVLVDELVDKPASLVAELDALMRELEREAAERKRLDALAHTVDATTGRAARALIAGGCGVSWAIFILTTSWLVRFGVVDVGHVDLAIGNAVLAAALFIASEWLRRVGATKVGVQYGRAVAIVIATIALCWLLLDAAGAPLFYGLVFAHIFVAVTLVVLSLFTEVMLLKASLFFVATIPPLLLWPGYCFEWNALANLLLGIYLAWSWRSDVAPQ